MNTINSDYFRDINSAPRVSKKPTAKPPVQTKTRDHFLAANVPADPSLNSVGVHYGNLEDARLRHLRWQADPNARFSPASRGDSPFGAPAGVRTRTGGSRGYGGGGASGPNPADYTAYADAMRQLIGSMGGGQAAGANPFQGMKNPFAGVKSALAGRVNPLTAMVDPAVNKDLAAAQAAMAQVAGGISMDNPYAAQEQAQAPTVDPRLAAFAQSQGVGSQYGADVALAQQDADTAAQNWAGLARALGTNHVAGQQGTLDIAKQQGAAIEAAIRAQGTGLRASAAQTQSGMDREAARDQQQLDMQSRGFEASLAQMLAQAQMQLDQQSRASAATAEQQKLAAIMELINAGLPYGEAPSLEGLI